MDFEDRLPLDISEFKCTSVSKSSIVVVFEQTKRRYVYAWRGAALGLSAPTIEGVAGPHTPEVIDCLARAVAYKAARDTFEAPKSGGFWTALPRAPASLIKDFLHMR